LNRIVSTIKSTYETCTTSSSVCETPVVTAYKTTEQTSYTTVVPYSTKTCGGYGGYGY
jgi:hypothetical protein